MATFRVAVAVFFVIFAFLFGITIGHVGGTAQAEEQCKAKHSAPAEYVVTHGYNHAE